MPIVAFDMSFIRVSQTFITPLMRRGFVFLVGSRVLTRFLDFSLQRGAIMGATPTDRKGVAPTC